MARASLRRSAAACNVRQSVVSVHQCSLNFKRLVLCKTVSMHYVLHLEVSVHNIPYLAYLERKIIIAFILIIYIRKPSGMIENPVSSSLSNIKCLTRARINQAINIISKLIDYFWRKWHLCFP